MAKKAAAKATVRKTGAKATTPANSKVSGRTGAPNTAGRTVSKSKKSG